MSDRLTGLGQTIDSYESVNGSLTLRDAYKKVCDAFDGCFSTVCQMGDLEIGDDCSLICNGESVALLDNAGYSLICKALKMPTPYILRLPKSLKKTNIEYWLSLNEEKDVSIKSKGGDLIEFRCDVEIELMDILEIAYAEMPNAKVFRTLAQTNAVVFDVYDEGVSFDTDFDTYFGGLRLVCKKGLNAPEISPILINANSCGIIDFADAVEKLNIKNLSYSDILVLIDGAVKSCVNALPGLFSRFASLRNEVIENPHRRIALYCRENNLPDRVRSFAIQSYDENEFVGGSYELVIGMFSVLGYEDTIKENSSRKAQRLAGKIAFGEQSGIRCASCDSIVNVD